MMNRLISIDIAKALCIILVVVGHYNPGSAPEWYHIIIRFIYTFHMPLFLFASGYIYATTTNAGMRGGEEFLHKKFKRLMIPYFSTSIIVISIKLLTQQSMSVQNPVTVFSYIRMLYLPEAGYFLWFIWTLWLTFLLVAFIKTGTGRNVLFAISLVIGFLPVEWPEIFCINSTAHMLKYFMFGVFLHDHPHWIKTAKKLPGIIPVCALPGLFVCSLFTENRIFASIINYTLPFIGIYAICILSIWIKNRNYITQKLLVVSASSYIIYLFHTTFEGFMKSVIQKIPTLATGTNSIYFSFGAVLVIGAGVFLPIVLHRCIFAKNHIFRFLFGLKPAK